MSYLVFSGIEASPAVELAPPVAPGATDYQSRILSYGPLHYWRLGSGTSDLVSSSPIALDNPGAVPFGRPALIEDTAPPVVPANISLPQITPTSAVVGQPLSVSTGTWTESPTSYAYQWLRGGSTNIGTNSPSYTPVTADIGTSTVSCRVTATNAAGSTPATSAAVSVAAVSAPANTVLPTITPTNPGVDTLVTAANGTWSGNPTPTFAYQWLRNGADISLATAQTYTVTIADRDAAQPSLAVRVTATNSQGSASATSIEYTVATETADVELLATDSAATNNSKISGAVAGDVISFGPGTYTGLATITPKNDQTYIARDGLGTVTLNGNAQNRRAFNGQFGADRVRLSGLIVTNYWNGFSSPSFGPVGGQNAASQAAIIHMSNDNERLSLDWVVEDCEIVANYGVGIRACDGLRISRCEISDNAHLGVAGPRQDMILEDSSLRNNCRWHMDSGWESGAVKWGGGATPGGASPALPPNKGHIVRRCTITNNFGPGLWWDWDCVNSEIHNNSIWGNALGAIILECCGAFHVHHNQLESAPAGGSGFWSPRGCFAFQNTKNTTLTNNLLVVRDLAVGIGSQTRGDGGGPQGGVYVGWFTGTENTVTNNVYLMINNGGFEADLQNFDVTNSNVNCTGNSGMTMQGTAESGCQVDVPPQGEIVREPDFSPGALGTSNFRCFLPGAAHDHFNVSSNNTYRMASTVNPTRWSFDTLPTIVLSANPAGSVPNWEVLPTWTTSPPGK